MDSTVAALFIILCLILSITVIAVVAMVVDKSDIAKKAIASLGNALKMFTNRSPGAE